MTKALTDEERAAFCARITVAFRADKYVEIRGAWGIDCVWAMNGDNHDLEDLPISEDLSLRLREWQEDIDRCEDIDQDKANLGLEAHIALWTPVSEAGLRLARAVKAELPDWTVVYHHNALTFQDRGPPCPPVRFRFEIGN